MIDELMREVDTAKVLAASAALQMDPANVNELLILERLSYFAAATVTEPGRDLSSSAVRRLLAADEVGGPSHRMQLDAFDGFPVVDLLYPPRRLMVVEGLATGSTNVASRLLRAVFAQSEDGLPEAFARNVDEAGRFLLGLSDVLCERFGRSPDEKPVPRTDRPSVPSAAKLAALQAQVVFSPSELFGSASEDESNPLFRHFVRLHGDAGQRSSGVESVEFHESEPSNPGGSVHPFDFGRNDEDLVDDSALAIRPIVKTHLGYIVASPGSLASAFRHYVITEAQRQDCVAALAAALAADTLNEAEFLFESLADDSLRRVDPQDPERDYNPTASSRAGGELIRLTATYDGDKKLDICLGVDSLENYDATTIWGHSSVPSFAVPALKHDPVRRLKINTYVGFGRDYMYLDNPGKSPKLFGNLEDFETLLLAPGVRKLTPWYFAKAWNRLAKQAQVFSFSIVDAFSVFRDHNDSFYFSDGPPPTAVHFDPASGQSVRELSAASRGPAFERYGRGFSRAVALHGDASPVSMLLGAANVCFIRLPYMTVWTRCRLKAGSGSPNMHPQSFPAHHLAEAVAYWLWQIHQVEPGFLIGTDGPPDLLVDIDAFWTASEADVDEGLVMADVIEPQSASGVVAGLETRHIALRVGLPSGQYSPDPENELDRIVVRCLLDALLLDGAGHRSWPPGMADSLVNRVAPPGYKTIIQVSTEDDDLVLWPGGLPSSNRVSDAAVAIVLDELGFHLKAQGMKPGPIPDDQRKDVLNTVVMKYVLDEFTDLVKTLDGDAAIRQCLIQHEAMLHEISSDRRRLPYTIACFGTDSAKVKEMRKRNQSETTTSIALRFIIEYLSALPPSGDKALNVETSDRLLALASEAVNKGQLSDALNLGLSDHQFSVLESGRFGISRDEAVYSQALDRFQMDRAQERIEQAIELAASMASNEADDEGDDDFGPREMAELDRLAEAEYGFSYTALTNACGALIDASRALNQEDLGQLSAEDATHAIVERLECSDTVADDILAALTLREHPKFWASGIDVYPWTFNRARSYLRQPLVEWESKSGEQRLLFGHRNLWITPRNWLERHLTGRLQATSEEMKSAMAADRDRDGARFETVVANAGLVAGATLARTRFKRAGRLDLSNVNGVDLGDVDVLLLTARGTIVAIEAKSLQTARTPRELANEMERLVNGAKAAVVRIRQRVAVLEKHVPAIETALGLPRVPRRPVVPLVVTDAPLLGSFLNESQVNIVAVGDLAEALSRIDRANRMR